MNFVFQQLEKKCTHCLSCLQAPCAKACPLHVSPKDFIALAKKQDYFAAIQAIYTQNPLGLICGYICPHHFYMQACTCCKIDQAVNISSIQAALIQQYGKEFKQLSPIKTNGLKVAVVGSGPAGIGAIWKLLQFGFQVELFEGSGKLGGSLNLIPEERLPRQAVENDYQRILQSNNIILHLNTMIRKPETLLGEGFCGVIIAVGTQEVNNLGIEGEKHIVSYVDYLSHPEKFNKAQKLLLLVAEKLLQTVRWWRINKKQKQFICLFGEILRIYCIYGIVYNTSQYFTFED